MIDLSVIILSYNTKDLTLACLQSVVKDLKNSSLNAEIIVLDNASTDGSPELIEKLETRNSKLEIVLVRSDKNLGFAKGNNLAAQKATGKWLLFLNSDTKIVPGTFKEMNDFLFNNPKTGIASCNLLNSDRTVQPQGGYLPRLSTVAFWALFLDDLPFFKQILPSYQLRRESFFTGSPKHIGWVAGTPMWVSAEL